MSRSPLKIREIALVCLPVGVIGVGGWFLAQRQKTLDVENSGPYRTEITSVESVPVTPFEAWQGFDTKLVMHVTDYGILKAPVGVVRFGDDRLIRAEAYLAGTVKGTKKRFPVSTSDLAGASRCEPPDAGILRTLVPWGQKRKEAPVQSLTILANTSKFDSNNPVHLVGKLFHEREAYPGANYVGAGSNYKVRVISGRIVSLSVYSQPANFDQIIRQKGEAKTVSVTKTPPTISNIETRFFSPRLFAGKSSTGWTGINNGGADVRVFLKEPFGTDDSNFLHGTAVQVFDERGNLIRSKPKDDYTDFTTLSDETDTNNPQRCAKMYLPLSRVPLSRGPLKMKIWLALGDSWPTLVQATVRKPWLSQRSHLLRLTRVTTEYGKVFVSLHYTGSKSLDCSADSQAGSGKFFDARTTFSQEDPPLLPSHDRMYTDWSQHFTLPNGNNYGSPKETGVASVSCDKNNDCEVVYRTSALNALKPGQSAKFHADIGIEDDGFLPIDTIINRPKS